MMRSRPNWKAIAAAAHDQLEAQARQDLSAEETAQRRVAEGRCVPTSGPGPWYRALIENARDGAGELGRIRSFISASCKLPDAERACLFALIEEYLPDAAPARATA